MSWAVTATATVQLLTCADRRGWPPRRIAAENIRRELKAAWPGVTFSVTSKTFSMGNSVDVRWTDGPTSKQVKEIADKYQNGDFDGMVDLYELRQGFDYTYGASKYVMEQRRETPDGIRRAWNMTYPDLFDASWITDDMVNTGRLRDHEHGDRAWKAWADSDLTTGGVA